MREYDTTFIVQPEISEEGTQAVHARLDAVLEKHDDIRLYCEDLGKRKLSYEIRKFHKGHYYTLTYLGKGQSVAELETVMRLDESVLRFLTVQSNDNVVDVEKRKLEAAEYEADQAKRAAEKAAREAEEAAAREESERLAAEERAAEASAAEARAAEAAGAEDSETAEAAEDSAPAAAESAEVEEAKAEAPPETQEEAQPAAAEEADSEEDKS